MDDYPSPNFPLLHTKGKITCSTIFIIDKFSHIRIRTSQPRILAIVNWNTLIIAHSRITNKYYMHAFHCTAKGSLHKLSNESMIYIYKKHYYCSGQVATRPAKMRYCTVVSTKYVHIKSTTVYDPRRNWDSPKSQPLSRQRVYPSPQKQGGGGTLVGGLGGSPNSDEGHTLWYSLYVCTLW